VGSSQPKKPPKEGEEYRADDRCGHPTEILTFSPPPGDAQHEISPFRTVDPHPAPSPAHTFSPPPGDAQHGISPSRTVDPHPVLFPSSGYTYPLIMPPLDTQPALSASDSYTLSPPLDTVWGNGSAYPIDSALSTAHLTGQQLATDGTPSSPYAEAVSERSANGIWEAPSGHRGWAYTNASPEHKSIGVSPSKAEVLTGKRTRIQSQRGRAAAEESEIIDASAGSGRGKKRRR
jgi:hypothetical protein